TGVVCKRYRSANDEGFAHSAACSEFSIAHARQTVARTERPTVTLAPAVGRNVNLRQGPRPLTAAPRINASKIGSVCVPRAARISCVLSCADHVGASHRL